MTKPFSIEELVERVKAVLRRSSGIGPGSNRLEFADLEMDLETRDVWRAGQLIELTPTEYKLLHYLLANARRVLTRDQILEHVWEYTFSGNASVLETYISYLRQKVDSVGPPLIHTVRGVGYTPQVAPRALTAGRSGGYAALETAAGGAVWTGAGGGTKGSLRVNIAPPPGALAAVIKPSCSAATAATMGNPRPAPAPARAGSLCQKRSKTCSRASSSSPGPWSRTAMTASPPSSLSCYIDGSSLGRVVQGVGHQVAQRLAQVGLDAQDDDGLRCLKGDGPAGGGRGGVAAGIGGQDGKVNGGPFCLADLVEPGQQQQVFHEPFHPGRLLFDPPHDRGLDRRGGSRPRGGTVRRSPGSR